jgi:hypothetical protein
MVFTLGIGTGVLGACLWDALGRSERISRLSDLVCLAIRLTEHAKVQGRYPEELSGTINELHLEGRVCPANLAYPAAGARYDKAADDMIVLRELSARRYGFVSGRFELRQTSSRFLFGAPYE